MRALKMIGGAVALAAVLAPVAQAQDTAEVRRLTILTFSAPVQLPGVTLPAGKYRFEMADINNAPHTVRVLSEDGLKVIGTFSTVPSTIATRDLRDTDTLVMWAERPAGQPQAAKEWYYPQRSMGEEFIYPREQALAIAAANHASVASEDNGKSVRVGEEQAPVVAQTTTTTETAPVAASTSATENQVAQNTTPAPAPAPRPERAVGTSGQGSAAAAPAPAPRTLPRTASPLALFELLSGLSIAGGLAVRHFRTRAARG
jgi:hypothetical protein